MVKRFECPEENFIIQSDNEDEVLDGAMRHMKKYHTDHKYTRDNLLDKMMTI